MTVFVSAYAYLRTPKEKVAQIIEKYNGGKSMQATADELHIHKDTVRRWLIRMNIKSRSRGYGHLKLGKNSSSWKGGKRHYLCDLGRTALVKAGIDMSRCMGCGGAAWDREHAVHHKDENRHNNNLENLELLCKRCHMLRHPLYKQKHAYNSKRDSKGRFCKK